MIDGLKYGEDPQQGYVENDVFYHPQLKFQFPTPKSWQTVNSNSQVQIVPKDGKAAIILTVSGEKSLAQAKQAAISADSLKVINSQNIKVNGNDAIALTADLNPQVRLLMYLIQYNDLIYKFVGLAETPNFNGYEGTFNNTFKGFKVLNDQSKINVYAEKINIVTVTKDQTLSDALKANNQPNDRLEELAILNGMELRDKVTKGMLIKTVEKGGKS